MEQTTLDNVVTTSDGGVQQEATIIPTWHVVLCLIIGTFGIFGNSLTLTVLFKRKRWTSVNLLIGIMSVSDLFVIPFVASATLQSYLAQRFYTYEATTYLRHTFMTSSYVCAMIIGCERSFAVRSPLKFRETWNTKLTLKLYAVCYIIFLAFVLSRSIISKLTSVAYFEAYFYVPYFLIVRGVPFVVILVTNILVIRGLLKNRKCLMEMTSQSLDKERIRTETTITRTVVGVTSVFFICMVPSRIAHGLMRAGLFVDNNSTTILLITALEMVNFSVNIIIYTVTSKQYRQEYSKLLSSCFCCFNTCRRSTKANDTCRGSTNASHTGHI
jgi:hypothetical protein